MHAFCIEGFFPIWNRKNFKRLKIHLELLHKNSQLWFVNPDSFSWKPWSLSIVAIRSTEHWTRTQSINASSVKLTGKRSQKIDFEFNLQWLLQSWHQTLDHHPGIQSQFHQWLHRCDSVSTPHSCHGWGKGWAGRAKQSQSCLPGSHKIRSTNAYKVYATKCNMKAYPHSDRILWQTRWKWAWVGCRCPKNRRLWCWSPGRPLCSDTWNLNREFGICTWTHI